MPKPTCPRCGEDHCWEVTKFSDTEPQWFCLVCHFTQSRRMAREPMSLKVHCDGPDCTHILPYDDTHITVALENPGTEPDDELNITEHQFCSMPCLSAWAYGRHLDADELE